VQAPMGLTLLDSIEIFLVGSADQMGRRMRRAKRQDMVDDFYGQFHVCDEVGLSVCSSIFKERSMVSLNIETK